MNERAENIGARRLHTVMERLLDDYLVRRSDLVDKDVTIDAEYVLRMLAAIVKDEDLSRAYPVIVRRRARRTADLKAVLCLLTLVAPAARRGRRLASGARARGAAGGGGVRRGDQVQIDFKIPDANTDRSTPADLSRVEVSHSRLPATSRSTMSFDGREWGTFAVNKPKDPDEPEPTSKSTSKSLASSAEYRAIAAAEPTGLESGRPRDVH